MLTRRSRCDVYTISLPKVRSGIVTPPRVSLLTMSASKMVIFSANSAIFSVMFGHVTSESFHTGLRVFCTVFVRTFRAFMAGLPRVILNNSIVANGSLVPLLSAARRFVARTTVKQQVFAHVVLLNVPISPPEDTVLGKCLILRFNVPVAFFFIRSAVCSI